MVKRLVWTFAVILIISSTISWDSERKLFPGNWNWLFSKNHFEFKIFLSAGYTPSKLEKLLWFNHCRFEKTKIFCWRYPTSSGKIWCPKWIMGQGPKWTVIWTVKTGRPRTFEVNGLGNWTLFSKIIETTHYESNDRPLPPITFHFDSKDRPVYLETNQFWIDRLLSLNRPLCIWLWII